MKRTFSILFFTFSILVLLVLSVFPHHHHQGIACVVKERCEKDGIINDKCTNHHSDSANNKHSSNCAVDSDNIVTKISTLKILSEIENYNHTPIFQAYFVLNDCLDFLGADSNQIQFQEIFFTCISSEVNNYNGLRAPPIPILDIV